MKKLFIAAVFVLAIGKSTRAQVDTRSRIFSLVPQASLPVGTFGETNKAGFGGNFTYQFYLTEKTRLLTSVGGALHQGKTYLVNQSENVYPAVALLGLKAGVKYYATQALFVGGLIGGENVIQSGGGKLGFAYTPLLGIELGGVDIYAKYNVVTGVKNVTGGTIQTLGFCLGYRL